ncbi:hypothetical protein DPSP01_007306 [Paraphaeosphaeria sporulosa]|uniref:Uncharacterized protein n=1 Tax=Paraphaeosphaeria sporulosa TaxID=1460663 RepID=A0A177C478_9PLEO|nr:uncharacterized protein CC84DRAFT_1252817 [Paraphaeosphaeria sporulosa]OAG02216.1 hypothetical protein CC84DRAFT_1252817 [Paraphaeosphaeria sporulosa]
MLLHHCPEYPRGAKRDLKIMGARAPSIVNLHPELSSLAEKLVCRRWNRNEPARTALVTCIVEPWGACADPFAAEDAEKRRKMHKESHKRQTKAGLVGVLVRQNTIMRLLRWASKSELHTLLVRQLGYRNGGPWLRIGVIGRDFDATPQQAGNSELEGGNCARKRR